MIGTGLIGGSVGLALRSRGWRVSGVDVTPGAVLAGMDLGAFDAEGFDAESSLVVVATPVDAIPDAVGAARKACANAVITDVGGVKGAILRAVNDPRFVGGHPMAGSEQIGLEGANANLFDGAAWVLTPEATTSNAAFALVRDVATSLGADVLTLDSDQHDALVAVVSHVPHLTAASLVAVAADRSEEHQALLRLAAGGFRDMTRVAAGSPSIWPDVCAQNRKEIVATLDRLIEELGTFRSLVDAGDRDGIFERLGRSQVVRRNLPTRMDQDIEVVEVRVSIADRPGEVAAVAVLATDLGVNLRALQTIDAMESLGGVLVMEIAAEDADTFGEALVARGHRPVFSRMSSLEEGHDD